jgi:prepilin-type N-terminal cleavage/methylation domain-containing protein
MIKNYKAFTLIELLVVVAIISILTSIGIFGHNQYLKISKDSVIKSNHKEVLKAINADISLCLLKGKKALISRFGRETSASFKVNKFFCSDAFDQGVLQIHFLGAGLRDPVIVIPSSWAKTSGTPNDVGAVYAGVPFKDPKYYPYYWVGKTYITNDWSTGKMRLKLQSYLMDEVTLLLDYIELPNFN